MRRTWNKIQLKSKYEEKLANLEKNILPDKNSDGILSPSLEENEEFFQRTFGNCSDIVFRSIHGKDKRKILVLYIDGLIDSTLLVQNIMEPLLINGIPKDLEEGNHLDQLIEEQLIGIGQIKIAEKKKEVIQSVVNANVVIMVEGEAHALIAEVKGWKARSIEEPNTEPAIRGPREGFTEVIRTNTSMIRRKIKSPKLKMESMIVGEITQTDLVITYIEEVVNQDVLEEVKKRIKQIKIDSILESGYIEEFIEDTSYSPFPSIQYTERPDVVASAILEGKVAIITDGTPVTLIVPFTFFAGLQASEDYYERFLYSSAIRWVRFILFNVALFLPSLYVSITTFHSQMLPTRLLLSFAAAREQTPFPTVVEALLMEIVFEALREAGVRLPKSVGSAVSIVGALVIGESAVRAGIVSAPVVIVVSGTGIASFAIPRYNLGIAYRILRFPLLILAGTFGLFGVVMGFLTILLHLVSLRSFGVPYLSPLAPLNIEEIKDTLWRAPRWLQTFRPNSIIKGKSVRIPKYQNPALKKK